MITLHLVPCWITAFPVCIVINNTMLHFMRETFSCGLLLRFTLFQTASSWAWKFYSLSYATIQTRPSNEKGNQPICKNSVNNNSPKLRFIKLLKPTSISEKTIKSIFFCDVDLPLFTVGDNFELQLIIKSGLKSLILPLFFQSFSISFRVLLVT